MNRNSFITDVLPERRVEPSYIDEQGTQWWFLNDKYEIVKRWFAPKEWHLDLGHRNYLIAVLHRVDGPAMIESKLNEEQWWINGKLHRDNGPAVSFDHPFSGHRVEEWYEHGVRGKTVGMNEQT